MTPMQVPPSFIRSGFDPNKLRRKFMRLVIGTEGESETGKTEFALSAPGPTIGIGLDRGYEGCIYNPEPPESRVASYAFMPVTVPLAGTLGNKSHYLEYWKSFYKLYVAALDNEDARTCILDGDDDSWELQRLAEFGSLTQVSGPPGLAYTGINAAKKAMTARAYDSGKNYIATNKLTAEYVDLLDKDGNVVLDDSKKPKQEKSGKLIRKGFKDTTYGFQVQLRHLSRPGGFNKILKKDLPPTWGIHILKCKPAKHLVGTELWGEDCNFAGLVQLIYPRIPLEMWGF